MQSVGQVVTVFSVKWLATVLLGGIALMSAFPCGAQDSKGATPAGGKCPSGKGGLKLPPGFCATVFADRIGHARDIVVRPDGVVYVNTWSGRYYGNDKPHEGGFLVALQDTTGSGHANVNKRFGGTVQTGSAGGTGIALYNGALYAEMNDRILRYPLPAGPGAAASITPTAQPDVIVSGLPLTGDHPMHPFVIDSRGAMYVDVASATNSCQKQNRMPNVPGENPCTELETRAGIWRYDANKTGQVFSPAERYATSIRNADGIAIDGAASGAAGLYATQHGRDQLGDNWSRLYTPQQGAEEPAEELLKIQQGGDYGWPECYFDFQQNQLVLAPEYGGDGGKTVGVCASKLGPIAAFPAHWAPNGLVIYSGSQFPQAYRGGAFIAFHGSWNRAPFPQGGYNVVFQPLSGGKASGKYVIFADGFAGRVEEPGAALHRPSGLAVGPDGSLYITDDQKGRVWKITYVGGNPSAKLQTVSATNPPVGTPAATQELPPEGVHKNAGAAVSTESLPVPPGDTAQEVALGRQVFEGQVGGAPCSGCHGSNAKGTPLGPDLTSGKWTWSDGSLSGIQKTITTGVPNPKNYRSPMPPMGGAQLSPGQVKDVAAYVWAVGHGK
jgi:glucose/arabinose dehydrogenase/mono/diheme cytochrome c family protein